MAARIVFVVVLLMLQMWQRVAAVDSDEPCSTPGKTLSTDDARISAFCSASRTWVVTGAGEEAATVRQSRSEAQCSDRPGERVCSDDCQSIGVCLHGVGWVKVTDCASEGKVCEDSATGVGCVNPYVGFDCAAEAPVEERCGAAGRYPVLDDCHDFLDCSVELGAPKLVRCPDGTAFDACTGECDVANDGGACAWDSAAAGVQCSEAGDWGPAPNNDRLFYLCAGDPLAAYWWRCPTGHFNIEGGCVDADVPGCGCGGSDSGSSTSTPTSTPTPTTAAPSTPECTWTGSVADPTTTCFFYYCPYAGAVPIRVQCNPGNYFDGSGCEPGVCS